MDIVFVEEYLDNVYSAEEQKGGQDDCPGTTGTVEAFLQRCQWRPRH